MKKKTKKELRYPKDEEILNESIEDDITFRELGIETDEKLFDYISLLSRWFTFFLLSNYKIKVLIVNNFIKPR